jgi:hypothetical protein
MFTNSDLEFQAYHGTPADSNRSTKDIISKLSEELLELRAQHKELTTAVDKPEMVRCDECGHEKNKENEEFICRDCVDSMVEDAQSDCDCDDDDDDEKPEINFDNIIIRTTDETISIETNVDNQLISLVKDIRPNSMVIITKDEIEMIKSRGF